MGGRAAEKIMCGEISSGAGAGEQSDLDKATAMPIAQERQWGLGKSGLCYAPVDSHQRHLLTASQQHTVNERLKAAEVLAVQTLTENLSLLGRVTEALLEKRELDERHIAVYQEKPKNSKKTEYYSIKFDASAQHRSFSTE